jgi:hypothetical protein
VRRRAGAVVLLPVVSLLVFALITAPRHMACMRQSHVFCFESPRDVDENIRIGLRLGQIGVRTYALLYFDYKGAFRARGVTVPDPFMQEHFGCLPPAGPLVSGILACYGENALVLPVYFGKKLIALFDNSFLNPYAALITTPVVWWWNRLFSMLAFAGFASLVTLATWAATHRRLPFQVALPLLYLAVYLGVSLIPHAEVRYGFPLVPASIVALALLCRETLRGGWQRWAIIALLACVCGTFLAQTVAWDRLDTSFVPPPAFHP